MKQAINQDNTSRITEVIQIGKEVIFHMREGINGRHLGTFLCGTQEMADFDFEELVKKNNLKIINNGEWKSENLC